MAAPSKSRLSRTEGGSVQVPQEPNRRKLQSALGALKQNAAPVSRCRAWFFLPAVTSYIFLVGSGHPVIPGFDAEVMSTRRSQNLPLSWVRVFWSFIAWVTWSSGIG
jgi:hypothetical protein